MIANAQTEATDDRKGAKKGTGRARAARVATNKGKTGKDASRAKKAPRTRKNAPSGDASKTASVLELLRTKQGATMTELVEATGWQTHSVRGFLSGTIRRKMGLNVASAKGYDGVRRYSIES